MEDSLKNYEAKIVEITEKIAKEKEALIGKREEAEKKLAEAKAKFDAIYGDLPTLPTGNDVNENDDSEKTLFDN